MALAPAVALADPGTAITVPWVPTNTNIPHVAYLGQATTLKGIVRGGAPTQFMWAYGDGTASMGWTSINAPANTAVTGGTACGIPTCSISVDATCTNPICTAYNLSVIHSYTGNIDQQFIATLYVRDATGNVASAIYPIQMYKVVDTTDPAQMDAKVAVAEDDALWNLHINQTHTNGQWGGSYVGGCAAVEALELHGSKPLQPFATDPYVEDVQLGLKYILSQAVATGIGGQNTGNPDTNGNGLGIYLGGPSGDSTYVDGICAAAFSASSAPNLVASSGPANVNGRTYGAIMQDIVDWFAYGQGDDGGWWYSANYGNSGDGSTNQWPIVAMLGAQTNMNTTVPAFVKNTIPTFLNKIHNTSANYDNGGYGYTSGTYIPNVAKTGGGIMGNFFVGQTNASTNVLAGMGMIYRKWTYTESTNGGADDDYNLGASYAMYDVMKAMQAATPPFTRIYDWNYSNGTQTTNSFDWYYSPYGQGQQGLAAKVISQQQVDHSFHDSDTGSAVYSDYTLVTAWDTLILMRAVSNVPPHAVICNCSAQWPVNSPVTFDGSCSVEPDVARTILNPSGYKWDFNYNGTIFNQSTDSNGLAVQGPVVTNTSGYAQYTEDGNGIPLAAGPVFKVALQVTDNTPLSQGGPQSNLTSCAVNIKPPPHCPQAVIGGPYIGYANLPVQFNATGSTQVDGDPLTYLWDFNNLNHFTDSDAGTPTHIWATAATLPDGGACASPNCTVGGNGTYPIELKVTNHPATTDAGTAPGCDAFAYATVVIGDHTPVANAGGPYTGLAIGDTITLDGTASYDPDKNNSGLAYSWDLAGAGTYTTVGARPSFTIPANTVVGTSFSVCVRVSDVSDASAKTLTSPPSCATVTAIRVYTPPNCVVAPVAVQSCNGGFQAVTVDGSHSTDPNGDQFTFAWTSSDCPAFDNPTSSHPSMQFSTAGGGKFWSPAQLVCIPQCTATLTVTNARNLSSSCSQVVKISDLQTPVFTTAPTNTTIECDSNAAANVSSWLGSVAVSDVCAPANKPVTLASNFQSAAGCGGIGAAGAVNGSYAVTFTATDNCNPNIAQTTATVTVTDTQPPVLTIPTSTLTAEAVGSTGATMNWSASAVDAAVGVRPVTCTPASGSMFPVGTTLVTCTSSDTTGHTATGTFSVSITDKTAPTLTVSSTLVAEANGATGRAISYNASAVDIVDGATTVTCAPVSGSVFAIGTTTVNCSTTDKHNNTATGSFNVKVQDTTPPAVTVPSNMTVEASGSAGSAVSFTASASDVVAGSTAVSCVPSSGSTFAIGTTTVTCSSTDSYSNKGTASFSVTVQDSTAPVVTVPANQVAEATGASGAQVTFTASATDTVDGNTNVSCSPATGSTFAIGLTTVTCSTADSRNNRSSKTFTVTVQDTTAPTVTVPSGVSLEATGSSGAVATFAASANDIVDGALTPTCAPASGATFAIGTTTVTCSSSDTRGNHASKSFSVGVQDSTPPVLTLPNSRTLEATGPGGAVSSFTATASDTVNGNPPVTCSPASGSTFPIGNTQVSCSSTDAHGNKATDTFNIAVQDTTPPTLSVPLDQVVEATGVSGATVNYSTSATDLVDGSTTVVCTRISGSTFPIRVTQVSCSSTDARGNKATSTFNVTVQDTTSPAVTVPQSLTVEATSASGAAASFVTSASDAVSGSTAVTCTPASGSTFAIATTQVTCTSMDVYGNKGTSSFGVTVRDTTAPALSIPSNVSAEASGPNGATVVFATSADDAVSGSAAVTCSPASGSTFAIGSTQVSCSTVDGRGNHASGTFNVIVEDGTPPSITVPADKLVEATSAAGAPVAFAATANDLVSGPMGVACVPTSGSTFSLGSTVVTCSSHDSRNNTSTSTFNVQVQDSTAPRITVPNEIDVQATGPDGALVAFNAMALDVVSGNTPINCSPASNSTFAIGRTEVDCASADAAGNIGRASFTVAVIDGTAPLLSGVAPNGALTIEATGPDGATVLDYEVSAMDIVDGAIPVTCTPGLPMRFPIGNTPVSCSALDAHGNTGHLQFTVDVVDTTPPAIKCPADINVASNGPTGAINWNVAEPTSDAIAAFLHGARDTDIVDPMPSLANNAPWEFPIGQTTVVTFTATDAHHNRSSCQAKVSVYQEQDWAPQLACPTTGTLSVGGGMELDWNAVFRHPVSVQLLIVNGGGTNAGLSLAELGDRSVQISSSQAARGDFAVRIRATDQTTGMSVDCNQFLQVGNAPVPSAKAKVSMRSAVPATPVHF